MKSDKELKQLAVDILAGKVFGTWNFQDVNEANSLVSSVFMPLAFMSEEDRKKLLSMEVSHFYETMDKAGPRSINGYPMFMSMQTLTSGEWVIVLQHVKELEAYIDGEEEVLQ